jgi:general secretion pathway protein G
MSRTRSRGFTLIELVVTLALVGVTAMVALPMAELTTVRAKESELRLALRQIRTALDAYKAAADAGQIEKMADQSGYPPTLEALTTPVVNIKNPKGTAFTFLRAVPRDPFEPDATLSAAETWNTRAYGTSPDSPAPGNDVFDVASRSRKTGLNGVAYRQW